MSLPTLVFQEAFSSNPNATVPAWETVEKIRSFDARQGKTSDLDRDTAGTARFVLDCRDRELDPANEDSSHWPDVVPNRQVRLAVGYVAEVFADMPRSYWRFNETLSNQQFQDQQRDTAITATGSPTQGVDGLLDGNKAVTFNGTTQYISTGDLSLFETGQCTYEVWVKTTHSGSVRAIFSEQSTISSNTGLASLEISATGKAQIGLVNNAVVSYAFTGNTTINDDEWHQLVLVRNGTDVALYVDGVFDSHATIAGTFTDGVSMIAGRWNGGSADFLFPGTIDELSVYNTALSAARIAAHYEAGISGIGGHVFTGFADAHNVSYTKPNDAVATIPATDRFKLLARARLTAFAAAEETTSLRTLAVLANVGLDQHRSVIIGNARMRAQNIADDAGNYPLDGTPALDAIFAATETENGRVFVDKDGVFRFIGRLGFNINPLYTTSQATFSDSGDPDAIPYTDIVFENSDTLLRNRIEIGHAVFGTVVASDPASEARFSQLAFQRTVDDATQVAQTATAEIMLARFKDPQTRVLSVTVPTSRSTVTFPNGLYGKVLSLALGMRVTVERTPPGGGSPISQECFILSQSHTCDAQTQSWTTTFGLTLAFETESYAAWDTAEWDDADAQWGY